MSEEPYKGPERRGECIVEHNEMKKEIIKIIKEWASDKICVATKGGKVWRLVMRPIIMLLLAGALTGTYMGWANDSSKAAVDADQTSRINNLENIVAEHHVERMKAVDKMDKKQEVIKRDVQQIHGDVQKILGILEK